MLQMDDMHQTARQAVTVTMRSVPQLRKLTRAAGGARDRMGTHARLLMRRTALAGLMKATRQLLEDLDTFFSMVDGTMARTHGRRVESLFKVRSACIQGVAERGPEVPLCSCSSSAWKRGFFNIGHKVQSTCRIFNLSLVADIR